MEALDLPNEESRGFSELDRGLPEEERDDGGWCSSGSWVSTLSGKISDRVGRCCSALWRRRLLGACSSRSREELRCVLLSCLRRSVEEGEDKVRDQALSRIWASRVGGGSDNCGSDSW